jgi:hypothetical protein
MVPRTVIVAALIASLVLGMVEMVVEAIVGAGFWAPVVFIAATLLRDLQAVAIPVPFLPIPVVLGLMGHMMNSVILGLLFARLVAPRLGGFGALEAGGAVYGLAVFVVMWVVIVPLVDPVMLHLNGVVFALAHLMWGAALGVVLGWRPLATLVGRPAH